MPLKANTKRAASGSLESEASKKITSMIKDVDVEIKVAGSKWMVMKEELRKVSAIVAKPAQEKAEWKKKGLEVDRLQKEVARQQEKIEKLVSAYEEAKTMNANLSAFALNEHQASVELQAEILVKDKVIDL